MYSFGFTAYAWLQENSVCVNLHLTFRFVGYVCMYETWRGNASLRYIFTALLVKGIGCNLKHKYKYDEEAYICT